MEYQNYTAEQYQDLLYQALDFGLQYRGLGDAADYLRPKDEADLDHWALALVDPRGEVYTAGDASHRFSIQSISKVVTFLILLENKSLEEIQKTIDIKPTAMPYNSLVDLELGKRKPRNPMVSIGAVATVALLHQIYGEDTFDVILSHFRAITGNPDLNYSKALLPKEIAASHNNIAGIHMMVEARTLPRNTDMQKVIETYAKCCILMVNTIDLARISHLLSNSGYNCHHGVQAYDQVNVRILRSIMAHSGMYDMSGEFAATVGLPAKSGIGGGIIACTHRGLGLATYSPRLGPAGNSIIGFKSLEHISKSLNLSYY